MLDSGEVTLTTRVSVFCFLCCSSPSFLPSFLPSFVALPSWLGNLDSNANRTLNINKNFTWLTLDHSIVFKQIIHLSQWNRTTFPTMLIQRALQRSSALQFPTRTTTSLTVNFAMRPSIQEPLEWQYRTGGVVSHVFVTIMMNASINCRNQK